MECAKWSGLKSDLSPDHFAHSIFYATWPGHEVVHGHMVVPAGGIWINGYGFLALKSSSNRLAISMVMVWLWRWMVRPSCLLDDGQWILVNMDWSLLIRWTLWTSAGTWGPGPFTCPFAASLDPGLTFFIFLLTALHFVH